jgi:hypothetical protein
MREPVSSLNLMPSIPARFGSCCLFACYIPTTNMLNWLEPFRATEPLSSWFCDGATLSLILAP